MRQPALVVVLCLASGAVGALLSRALFDEPSASADATVDTESLRELFRGLETRLDRLHIALSGRPLDTAPPPRLEPLRPGGSRAAAPPSNAEPPPDAAPAGAQRPRSVGDDALRRELGSGSLPAMQKQSLDQLLDDTEDTNAWQADATFRRRWMFLSEASALAHFGTPTSVEIVDGGMAWRYRVSEDGRRKVDLRFFQGRLIAIYMKNRR